jgi:S-formylglutathione hydrolase FrmB
MRHLKPLHAALFVVSLCSFVLAGCHSVQQVLPDHPRLVAGVVVQDVIFHSTALNREMTYRVYLPEKIAPGKRLPVVYLLHGNGGSFRNWSNYSDVAKYAVPNNSNGLILVMAEGESSYYMNAAEKPADKYEDYLVNDLITDVESRFPANKGREGRAVVGVSMGGFAAVKLALSRPELFSFAGAISPAIDVPSRKFTWKRYWQWERFKAIFGAMDSKPRRDADPFVLVQSASPAQTPYLYITAGEQEGLLEPIQRFVKQLKQRGFAYEFHTKPGGHDWGEWGAQIPGCFESLLSHLNHNR